MLIIRLMFILLVITAMVLLGLYLFLGDNKYLHYCKQTLKYMLFFVFAFAIAFVLRGIL